MKIIHFRPDNKVYTSNVYLVLGDWNAIDDVNTLVDVGSDPKVVHLLKDINTGVGKKKIDQVILTHNHSDHAANIPVIRDLYAPVICAFSPYQGLVDRKLSDGQVIRLGDRDFEVIHIPDHSFDSIALFNADEGVFFSGDAPLFISTTGGTYGMRFRQVIESLCRKDIRAVYPGHGEVIRNGIGDALRRSLRFVAKGSEALKAHR